MGTKGNSKYKSPFSVPVVRLYSEPELDEDYVSPLEIRDYEKTFEVGKLFSDNHRAFSIYKQYFSVPCKRKIDWSGTYCIAIDMYHRTVRKEIDELIEFLSRWHPREGHEDRWLTKVLGPGTLVDESVTHVSRAEKRGGTQQLFGGVTSEYDWKLNELVWNGVPILEDEKYQHIVRDMDGELYKKAIMFSKRLNEVLSK